MPKKIQAKLKNKNFQKLDAFLQSPIYFWFKLIFLSVLFVLSFLTLIAHIEIAPDKLKIFIFPYISFVCATLTFIFFSYAWFQSAILAIKKRIVNYAVLVVSTTIIIYLLSSILWGLDFKNLTSTKYFAVNKNSSLFTFYEGVTFIFYFAFLTNILKDKLIFSREKFLSINKILPDYVELKTGFNSFKKTPVKKIILNDIVLIGRGSVVPFDGVLVSQSALLECNILASSKRFKVFEQGNELLAGMVNLGGQFLLKVTALHNKSFLNNVFEKLDAFGNLQKGKIAQFNKYLKKIPLVQFGLALLYLMIWLIIALVNYLTNSGFTLGMFFLYLINYGVLGSLTILIFIRPSILRLGIVNMYLSLSYYLFTKQIFLQNFKPLSGLKNIDTIILNKKSTIMPKDLTIVNLNYIDNNFFYLSLLKSLQINNSSQLSQTIIDLLGTVPLLNMQINKHSLNILSSGIYAGKRVILLKRENLQARFKNIDNYDAFTQNYLLVYGNKVVLGFDTSYNYDDAVFYLKDFVISQSKEMILLTDESIYDENHTLWKAFQKNCIYFNVAKKDRLQIISNYKKARGKKVLYIGDLDLDQNIFQKTNVSIATSDNKYKNDNHSDVILTNKNLKGFLDLLKLCKVARFFYFLLISIWIGANITILILIGVGLLVPSIGAVFPFITAFATYLFIILFRLRLKYYYGYF